MTIKVRAYHIAMLPMCIMVVACSEEVTSDIFGQRTPIEIKAIVTSQDDEEEVTRAQNTLNTDAGFTLSETADFNKVNVNIDGDDYIYSIKGESGATTGTMLDIDVTKPLFPLGATSIPVYAHYPNTAGFSTVDTQEYFTIQQDQTTQDAYLCSDLMTAAATATRALQTNGSWNVTEAELVFHHMMSKIVVNAYSEDESIITIKQIVLNGVKPRVPLTLGEYGYEVGAATTNTDGSSYDVNVLGAFTGTGQSAVLIPSQTFAPEGEETQRTFATITVDYKNPYNNFESEEVNLYYYFTGSGKTFSPDKVYTMNIVVGVDNFVVHNEEQEDCSVDISAWNTANSTTINIYPTVVHTSLRTDGRIILKQNGVEVAAIEKTYTGNMITLSEEELLVEVTTVDEDNVTHTNIIQKAGNYATTYEDNVDVGTAKVTIVGIGNYSGTLTAQFTIKRKTLDVTIEDIPAEDYDGYPHRPAVKLTDNVTNKTLFLDTDFSLEYLNNTNAGTATINITGINNYVGSASKTFTINQISGRYTFTDAAPLSNPIRRYKQTTTEETVTYKNTLASIVGDGQVTSASSSNNSVATVADDGTVTMVGTGTAKITLNLTGTNYTYEPYEFYVKVKVGPILPIMYVGPCNMKSTTEMADKNWSTLSCYFSWNPDLCEQEGGHYIFDIWRLKQYGITVNGVSYHLPSYNEWLGILPKNGNMFWGKAYSVTDVSDSDVKFAVTSSHTDNINASDYSYQVSATSSWKSDYYSDGNGTVYALRFKGSNYCCAYRYDRLTTMYDNASLTGNTNGKESIVIRVVHLGSGWSSVVSSASALATNMDWERETDYTVSLPICVFQSFASKPGAYLYYNDGKAYYLSATQYSENSHYFVYSAPPTIDNGKIGVDNTGVGVGYNVRMFRDY